MCGFKTQIMWSPSDPRLFATMEVADMRHVLRFYHLVPVENTPERKSHALPPERIRVRKRLLVVKESFENPSKELNSSVQSPFLFHQKTLSGSILSRINTRFWSMTKRKRKKTRYESSPFQSLTEESSMNRHWQIYRREAPI